MLYRERKHFCLYYLQYFNPGQILERHATDCFENIRKQMIKVAIKGENVKSKNFMSKSKLPFMVYVEIELQTGLMRINMKITLLAVLVIS